MRTASISSDYLDLIERFPLRPLRSGKDLAAAARLLDELLDRQRSRDEDAYLDVLSVLIERYEDDHHRIEAASGREMLAHLIEAGGQSVRKVALDTGIQPSTLSEILSGSRDLNVAHMRKLAPYFGVEPGVFVPGD